MDHLLLVFLSAAEYGAALALMPDREGEGEARPRLPLRIDIRLVWLGDITGDRGVLLAEMVKPDLCV